MEIKPKRRKLTSAEKAKIVTLRKKHELSINQIGAILKREPSAIYKHINKMGLEKPEFKVAKELWHDVKIAQSLKAGFIKEKVLDSIDMNYVATLPEDIKARMAKDLAFVEGISVDQAPKVVINQQVNINNLNAEIEDIEAQLRELTGNDIVVSENNDA